MIKTQKPRFVIAAPPVLVYRHLTGLWSSLYFSFCKVCQRLWLFTENSVNMVKLSDPPTPQPHPRSRSITCLWFVNSLLWPSLLLHVKYLKGFKSNPELSDERRSRQRNQIKASLCVQVPFWESDRLLPLHPFCNLWRKKNSMGNLKKKCSYHGKNDCDDFSGRGLFWFVNPQILKSEFPGGKH